MSKDLITRRNHLLADALKRAKEVSKGGVVRSADLDRGVRERLVSASFLTEVMRGWYLLTSPAGAGTTTLWYSNYWEFIRQYLSDRFGDGYCLSAESSLDVYAAQNIISQQLIVLTKKPSNQSIELLHSTSLMLYCDEKNFPETIVEKNGLNLFPLPESICRATPTYFQNSSLNAEICLKLIPSAAEISRVLLTIQSQAASNRIIGAYQRLGDQKRADQVMQDLAAAGLSISPQDPFDKHPLYLGNYERLTSPYSGRIRAMWESMRPVVIEHFPKPPLNPDSQKSLRIIEKLYNQDAYHSLSIEGYQVTEDLILNIKEGTWNPDTEKSDNEQRNALAAKGYLGAFRSVFESVITTTKGENPGKVFANDLQKWYRELFIPLVQAGLIAASDLAGYRNHPVYISGSRHVPPPKDAVLDSMDTLEQLLMSEPDPAVRAVLGHFIFVYIHPYMDGNGRIGRFLMNLMLVSGGYNWTVVRTSERARYMASLETASTQGRIDEFSKFIASEMDYWKNEISKLNVT
ncbi:MAG: hypothetical protein A2070_02925 [Bdellovibrionales bacterium GWC1_52_8]|nr:MAG: hypothetical protein A2Z97_08520 [Bdellovibrionales bacterium GWB1_52_6]OFZ02401.1 MAG: hypothetical protein A2X97_12690 [Bdellovibrionales bacterium GWA1_52_35]OFZ34332.1 MAG: hypothetical protein A2070_02925 [Bdellovibrionales bacterium GWC1_52_8]